MSHSSRLQHVLRVGHIAAQTRVRIGARDASTGITSDDLVALNQKVEMSKEDTANQVLGDLVTGVEEVVSAENLTIKSIEAYECYLHLWGQKQFLGFKLRTVRSSWKEHRLYINVSGDYSETARRKIDRLCSEIEANLNSIYPGISVKMTVPA